MLKTLTAHLAITLIKRKNLVGSPYNYHMGKTISLSTIFD